MRRIAVLDAPSNLGLRPPTPTSTPGCAKAPGALRDQGLVARLAARDAGCLTPPRYDPGDWRPGDGVCHAPEIAAYSLALAARIGAIIDADEFPLVLGGDCSILLGAGLAMHRLGEAVGGRIGLVFVDGHSDFRHPGNASYVGAAAGEDLALATGRGQPDLAAIEGRRPYFRDVDVVVLGIRAQDEYRLDLQAAGIVTRPVPALRAEGAARSAQWARDQLADCAGYWVHVDVDVLDPAVMPAVDAPDPGGIAFAELELLIAGLVDTPHCLGLELTVFDPDYDPDGAYAAEITSAVVAGLAPVRASASAARPASALAFTPRVRPPAPRTGEPPAGLREPDGDQAAGPGRDPVAGEEAAGSERREAGPVPESVVGAAATRVAAAEAASAGGDTASGTRTAASGTSGLAGGAARDGAGGAAARDGAGGALRDAAGGAAGRDGAGGAAWDDAGGSAERDGAGGSAGRDGAGDADATGAGGRAADRDGRGSAERGRARADRDGRGSAERGQARAADRDAGDAGKGAGGGKRPTIGRQRRSAFDVIAGDGDGGRPRRSAADILAAPLGEPATGPGRLRRATDAAPDGPPTAEDAIAPGRLRRSAADILTQPQSGDARPVRQRAEPPPPAGEAGAPAPDAEV